MAMGNSTENNINLSSLKEDEVAVVLVPLDLQSHLTQLLQLACLISSYGVPVFYVALPESNHRARLRATTLDPSEIAKIHFYDLPNPTHDPPQGDDEVPLHIWTACMRLREPIAAFLRRVSLRARRLVVIHDLLMSYNVQDIAFLNNAESYTYNAISLFDMYSSHYAPILGLPIPLDEGLLKRLPSNDGCYNQDDVNQHSKIQSKSMGIKAGDLYNTSVVIDGTPFMEMMEQMARAQDKKVWAVGPVIRIAKSTGDDEKVKVNHFSLDWLSKQPPKSVLYVSFGTSTAFSAEQINELAIGLERSGVRFIWVLRKPDQGDPVTNKCDGNREGPLELPEGFEERVKGVGLVVREWAPQPEILAHGSTGGFMSHCGWTSCLESIGVGVPIVAWPIQFDQPKNGFLMAEVLKAGVLVRDWDKRDELVKADTIESAVKKLMVSEEGDCMRKRAEELGEALRKSIEVRGSSKIALDSFVHHITRP